MCGIIGYSGKENAKGRIFECLKKLDYRGYDSWGIAVAYKSEIIVAKKAGRLPEKNSEINLPNANMGVGHTRWATHGGVTEKNAHPHLSNNGKIAVVHNGIIENFEKQKEFLKSKGFIFNSETDTETIPNTIEYHMGRGYDFIEAAKRSLRHLEGQYAVIAMDGEGKMVAVRKEAPLVAGIGKDEYFFASDVTAFLEHTKDAIFLEENEMAIIEGSFQIFNMQKNVFVERNISKIEWDAEQAKKGDFDHFFLKEIMEQANVIERISKIDPKLIKEIADEIKKANGVYIVACGTASYACLHGLYTFSKIAKKHINFCVASEFQHFKHFLTDKSLIIAVSQSGETADTLCAIRAAKSMGAKVVSITNSMGSSLMRESHKSILQKAGPEIAVNSTKAYTSQLALLGLIAYELAGNLDEGIAKLNELSKDIFYLTSENARKFVKTLAEKLKDHEHIYLVGRGMQYPTALEAAHKIKEVSYIHAEAFAAGELKHGPNALITKGTPYVIFTADENEKEIISSAMEVKARGAYVIGVGPKNNDVFDYFIKVREAGDFNSIVQIIPMQILSYQLALLRGCDPDKPRNLAKSVTVK
ncbi:MAG: glutamine--fructose-6-phosphate transaminase (isomerizing) [Nanoarchaeota archaeon]|nr:glutamine--fructose-6-phosphate transaminase (isomerizing) [Nanoarchaeota archaeon]MBU4300136.1 glutamine--fructose-6-phosphate transaminase (isomerizing) [Nanoarchaeota archaeon]MBU4451580.1 glutamine--fructose-6-phosphate transaminase (isomerizing) [Nanoarchaeota archaeon]MCG2724342.1 glutamine--fructose-6-phosphate transaminase (isomerizing) [archaeon]